jgi:hypothetical protein
MAVYTPSQLKITPPKEGFQTGGWYSGRQYWNGTLSEPGQEHPESSSASAGQNVSNAVIAQTNPANVAYIASEKAKAAANPVTPQTSSQPTMTPQSTGATTDLSAGITSPETINLPQIYQDLYKSSGISEIEANLSEKTKGYNEAVAKIKDNPYLSEGDMTGRLKKIDDKFNADAAALKNDIATKKADVETQLNLQTKQFDINSTVAQEALTRLNTLLNMGALDNASGETIASLTRSTGISSDLINSAVAANKAKNVKTQVITSTADSGEVTISVVNTDTGAIIKQTSLGKVGNAQTGAKTTEAEKEQYYKDNLVSDASKGVTLSDMFKIYGSVLDPQTIYNLYNINSIYGAAKESAKELEKYGVKLGTSPAY